MFCLKLWPHRDDFVLGTILALAYAGAGASPADGASVAPSGDFDDEDGGTGDGLLAYWKKKLTLTSVIANDYDGRTLTGLKRRITALAKHPSTKMDSVTLGDYKNLVELAINSQEKAVLEREWVSVRKDLEKLIKQKATIDRAVINACVSIRLASIDVSIDTALYARIISAIAMVGGRRGTARHRRPRPWQPRSLMIPSVCESSFGLA